ncbi:DNA polymerase III, alpha subunit [Candidatus Moduliflexus flocculans]|uniref:DNA polymerase III, alpha subunit n=1 Tax=Candidatus Moduliflexus flocculans TaxID=1499966 RepID=A0A081BPV8_9BACT|nr:DNA polymerase III, alpha subunit [Candidatus Moduliflexus flocculans]
MNVDMPRLLRMVEEAVSATPKDRSRLLSILRECAALGVDILPLDINASDDVCALEGERGLRLGFSALITGRQQFVQDILAERQKKGAFRAFQHFCERVQVANIPTEFFEKCICAGVFDSIEASRAALLAGYQKIIAAVNAANAERASSQFSLFAALPAQPRPVPLPKVTAWTDEEMIEQENASLGFSFTEFLIALDSTETADGEETETSAEQAEEMPAPVDAPQLPEDRRVELPEQAVPASGDTPPVQEEPAAVETPELPGHSDEPEIERVINTENDIRSDEIRWKEGREDALPVADVPVEEEIDAPVEQETAEIETRDDSVLVFALSTALASAATLRRLRDVLECHPGNVPVVFEFGEDDHDKTRVRVHQDYFVTVSDELRQALLQVVSQS